MRMKAVLVRNGKSDKAEDLYIGEYDVPSFGDHEVLVEVKAFGLNRMDILQRRGLYPLPPSAPKDILGVEFSGVVSQKGANVTEVQPGDQVFGLAYGGAYGQYLAVDAQMVVRKPPQLSWTSAAAIPEAWLTAYQALRYIGSIRQGDRVLMHAGASGVGLAAIQLAHFYGASQVYATAGTDAKTAFLERLGATKAINYKTSSFREVIARETNEEGIDLIIDPVGQSYITDDIASLRRDGRLVLLGFMSGSKLKDFDIAPLLYKRLRVEGTTLRSRSSDYQARLLQDLMRDAMPKFTQPASEGGFELVVHKVYPVADIVQATLDMQNAANTGKLVVEW